MIINSALNEGLAGMQQSQKRLQQAAEDIVKAGVPTEERGARVANGDRVASTNTGTAVDDLNAEQSVEATAESERSYGQTVQNTSGVVEPLVEQIEQQLVFDASANVVKVDNQTKGSLIDDLF